MENTNNKGKHIIIIMLLTLCFIMQVGITTYAATISTIPDANLQVSNSSYLKLSSSNYTVKWNGITGKVATGKYSTYRNIMVPIKSKTSSFTYTNFLDIDFTNIGNIGGRQLDATLHFNSFTVGPRAGSAEGERTDNYMSICYLSGAAVWMGGTITDGGGYRAKKTADVTLTIKWHDTGETVDLPFFQKITDIDAGDKYYKEAWTSSTGFSGIFYKYSTCNLVFSGNTATSIGTNTSGTDSLLKTGFYAPTTTGTFRSVYTLGNCSTQIIPYSSYAIMNEPVKTSDGKDKNFEGDSINYSITQKTGKFFVDMMTPYKSFEMKDKLPEGLTYQSAKVFDGSGKDITSQGKITYEPVTREVKFTMGASWLSNTNNYNGQTLKMDILTTAAKPDVPVKTVTNESETVIDTDVTLTSNKVTDKVYTPYKASYKYVSGTDGRKLPEAISTISGAYKVSDTATYYQGDTVNRKSSPAEGASYKVYDSNNEYLGQWILSWDSEQKKIDGSDVIFTGTWRYVPQPRILILKSVTNSDNEFNEAHGEPTFIFKITGKTSDNVWYKSVTYSSEAISKVRDFGKYTDDEGTQFSIKDGKIYSMPEAIYVPEDDYIVEEISTARFKQNSCQANYHGESVKFIGNSKSSVTVPLKLSTYKDGELGFNADYVSVSFDNSKMNWSRLSHNDIIINKAGEEVR